MISAVECLRPPSAGGPSNVDNLLTQHTGHDRSAIPAATSVVAQTVRLRWGRRTFPESSLSRQHDRRSRLTEAADNFAFREVPSLPSSR